MEGEEEGRKNEFESESFAGLVGFHDLLDLACDGE
jgi:hypothetical protein